MFWHTGTDPLIEHEAPTVIRISHESGPLRVEVVYRRGSRGWQQSDCRLLQNGGSTSARTSGPSTLHWPRSWAQGADGPARLPDPAPLGKDELPTDVHNSLAALRRRLGSRSDVAVCIGQDGKGRYVLALESSRRPCTCCSSPDGVTDERARGLTRLIRSWW